MIVKPLNYTKIPDWNKLRKRYLAFWDKKIADSLIVAHIQNPNDMRPEPEPWMLEESEEKYLNPEKLFELQQYRQTGWNWHGDLFQYKVPSYGPNIFAGFCGAKVMFGRDTVWHEPTISGLDESDEIFFDLSNRYWKAHIEAVECFVDKCAGSEQIATTDFGGPADWISCLMGTENCLIATIEQPEKMHDFALRLAGECNRAFDILFPIITAENDGQANWMPVWSDVQMGTVQDDMAINFSPEMYADIFMPALKEMAVHTKHTVLHWHDGCAQHLDSLLKVNEIDLIQYGHDPNTGSFRTKIQDMQKIQTAGKKLLISCVESEDAEYFIRHLNPQGLMMIINTADDKSSMKMVNQVAGWTKNGLE